MICPTRSLTLTTLALALAAGPALAGGPPGRSPSPPSHHNDRDRGPSGYVPQRVGPNHFTTLIGGSPNNHPAHATKFAHGYFYPGFNHSHWSRVYIHPVYGCRVYYCPYTLVEYYWCPPDNCYYPISYCPYGTYLFP
jgi:hypothetical protein